MAASGIMPMAQHPLVGRASPVAGFPNSRPAAPLGICKGARAGQRSMVALDNRALQARVLGTVGFSPESACVPLDPMVTIGVSSMARPHQGRGSARASPALQPLAGGASLRHVRYPAGSGGTRC
jgi:hypothetical protein